MDLERKEMEKNYSNHSRWERMSRKLLTSVDVESRGKRFTYLTAPFKITIFEGILPVPLDERIDKPYIKNFFMWFSMNFNILSYEGFLDFGFCC